MTKINISDVAGLRNSLQIEVLQDQTHLMLQEYCSNKAPLPSGKLKFGKILLTMPLISQVNIFSHKNVQIIIFIDYKAKLTFLHFQISPRSVEALFFRKTVGNIAVERVISDLFHGS